MRAILGLLVAALSVASCARCRSSEGKTEPSASASAAPGDAQPRRCTLRAPAKFGGEPGDDPVAFGAEIGGAASLGDHFVVGARASGPTGAAQVLEIDGAAPRPLVTLAGARSAPLVATAKDRVLAAWLEELADTRVRHVVRVANGKADAIGDVVEAKDESAFAGLVPGPGDGALVVWDDVDEKEHRGRVRVRSLPSAHEDKGDAGSDDGIVSLAASDAAFPVMIASPQGDRALVLWLSEKPEAESDGGGEPSQAEAYRWAEAVVVDVATGKPLGAPRALTAQNGHAQTIAAAWIEGGFIAVVRDDARPTDGDGGQLVAYKATVDAAGNIGVPERAPVAEQDVEPGVAFVLPRQSGALVSYLSSAGEARLVPVFAPAQTTVESALEGRRITAAAGDRVLTTKLSGSAIELALATCLP